MSPRRPRLGGPAQTGLAPHPAHLVAFAFLASEEGSTGGAHSRGAPGLSLQGQIAGGLFSGLSWVSVASPS